jgi:hypothetical protein
MKRTPALLAVLAPSLALLLGASLPACSAPSRPTVAAEPFEDDTWMLLRGDQTGLVEVALPGPDAEPVFATGDFVAFARDLIVAHPALFGVRDPATLVLNGTEVAADGTTDVSFRQVVSGGRVLETDLLVRIAKDGSLRAVIGSLRAIDGPLPPATITPAQAIAAAAQVTTPDGDAFTPVGDAELVVEQIDGTTTYGLRYAIDGTTANGPAQVRVNARTGVASFEGLTDADVMKVGTAVGVTKVGSPPVEGTRSFPVDEVDGRFFLRTQVKSPLPGIAGYDGRTPRFTVNRCRSLTEDEARANPGDEWNWVGDLFGTQLNGMVVTSDPPPSDPSGIPTTLLTAEHAKGMVDAYPNLIAAEGWFHKKYKTNSFNGAGAPIMVCLFDNGCNGSMWNAKVQVFGIRPPCMLSPIPSESWENRGPVRRGLAESKWFVTPDTLVHEFAHALTVTPLSPHDPKETHKADAVLPQTWAVAEHVADAFAVIYNHEQTPDAPLAVVANFDGGRPLRDFANPHEGVRGQPRWMGEAYQGTPTAGNKVLWEDNAGAHLNSGIGNHAFALAVQGGSEPETGASVLEPATWEEMSETYAAAFLAPKALSARLPKTLLETGGKLIDAATTPRAKKALLCAWGAVGLVRAKDQKTFRTGCTGAATLPEGGLPATLCEGHADGFYCRNDGAFSAVQCVGGKSGAGFQCPSGTACSVAGDGTPKLVCPNLCANQPDGDACLPDPADGNRRIGVHCKDKRVGPEKVTCPAGPLDAGAPRDAGPPAAPAAADPREDAHCAYAPGRAPKGAVASAIALLALAITRRRRG